MRRKRSIDWLLKNYFPFLERFGMDEKNIRENYTKNWENKDKADVESYLWSIFNLLIDENFKQSQGKDLGGYYDRNREIYGQMATFLVKYKKKPATYLRKLYNENYINQKYLEMKDNIFQIAVSVICGSIDCKCGNELKDKLFSMEEAIENNIIPYDKCTDELGCFCFYGVAPRRDESNDLIYKDDYLIKEESKKKKGCWSKFFP